MAHKCKALVISCMDFRLHAALHSWASAQFSSYDVVHLAGGARAVIDPLTQPVMLKQIELATTLHGVDTVALVNHLDCGAVGGSAAFGHNETKEYAACESDLAAADDVVHKHFPSITVVTALQALDGSVKEAQLLAA